MAIGGVNNTYMHSRHIGLTHNKMLPLSVKMHIFKFLLKHIKSYHDLSESHRFLATQSLTCDLHPPQPIFYLRKFSLLLIMSAFQNR